MPTDPAAGTRRQVWAFAVALLVGAFELGRWAEAADPRHFPRALTGPLGAVMVVAAVLGLRGALRRLEGRPGGDAPAR
jgi:hypothetical protein